PIIIFIGLGIILSRPRPSSNDTELSDKIVVVPKPVETNTADPAVSKANQKVAATKPSVAVPTPKPKGTASQSSGAVIQQVLPDIAASARRTITGTIRIRVKVAVDSKGNVNSTTLDSPSKSSYFNRLSQQAAEKWKFAPASGQWMIHFAFTSKDTTANAEQMKQ